MMQVECWRHLVSLTSVFLQFENRFGPAILQIQSMSTLELFFGKGLGTTFEIPWFTYRESVNDLNTSIDSLYLTLYTKLGVVSVILLALFGSFFAKLWGRDSVRFVFFMALMGVVSAHFYTFYAMGFVLFMHAYSTSSFNSEVR